MPLVRVDWYPGRSQLTKDVLSRRILEAFDSGADCPSDTVQIIYSEVAHSDWTLGANMMGDGTAAPRGDAAAPTYAAWLDLTIDADSREVFAAWHREHLVPLLAGVTGFLGVDLYALTEVDYRLCVRWNGDAATEQCFGQPAPENSVWTKLETFAHNLTWQRGVRRRE
jgi:phenylpyruvate tautomerase PptA (4-oxalocrotonate tautomerase family)